MMKNSVDKIFSQSSKIQ